MLKTPTPRGPWKAQTLFPLPVDEKAIMNNTPDKRACDGHFPLPVKGKAIPSHRALRSPTEPFRALRSPMCTPAPRSPAESRGSPFPRLAGGKVDRRHPRTAFSSTGKGKRAPCARATLFLDRQSENSHAFSSTGRAKTHKFRQAEQKIRTLFLRLAGGKGSFELEHVFFMLLVEEKVRKCSSAVKSQFRPK